MKRLFIFIFLFTTINLLADTPGKKQMHDSKISFQNISNLTHSTWHWQQENSTEVISFRNDTSFYMSASRGAPITYKFWSTNEYVIPPMHSDTILFRNYYSPDYVIIINSFGGNKIKYTQKELSNKNTIVSNEDLDSISNKQLVADAKKAKQNHYLKIGLFSVAGLVALGGVVWFFRRRKEAINRS
jgi:LPXTG-motif cell wall-anchored protein